MKSTSNKFSATTWRKKRIFRLALSGAILAALFALGFFLLAWRSAITPIEPPSPTNFPAALVAKGETLSDWTLCGMPHPARRTTVCRRICNKHAIWDYLWNEYHSRPENRYRGLVVGGFRPRHARGRRSRWVASFPCVPLQRITPNYRTMTLRALYAYLMTRPASQQQPCRRTRFRSRSTSALSRKAGRFCSSGADAIQSRSFQERRMESRSLSRRSDSAIVAGCHTPRNLARRRNDAARVCGRGGRRLDRACARPRPIPRPSRGRKKICSPSCAPARARCTVRPAPR